ncbi:MULTISPECIES: uridine kinase [Anaerococcus]|jgi:uridine kinase|uniref:Uridine kinase n=1 Tax=Anaerococcus octavius TaxID=54007 RepID=A0A2I1M4W2_9FIRM|nr:MULTISPECIES: uridine kinase [Anaerococcus]MBS6106720.1 uridine kinase [Anaerococcus sp.]MDU0894411.1 uridine kinase [Anaerococcus sp.]MDU2598289.1 uridine kinase [Anaerococcus sp.]MDU3177202.1 uridine kinase [Anaerococcus sp.]MDU7412560.1 uridine kinase [Anaerococcus sp.]
MSDVKIIAIAGGSASGKSSIVNYIDDYFKEDLIVIGHDNYYKAHDDISFDQRAKLNYDYPGAFDNDLFFEDLKKLQAGISIQMPTYDYTIHTRSDKTIKINPTKIILIEGILVLGDKKIRDITDTKVFIDADSDVRLQRRILRDTKERGRSLDSVLEQFIKQVKPMHEKYVEPTKKYADIIIPRGAKNTKGIEILVRHITHMIEDK